MNVLLVATAFLTLAAPTKAPVKVNVNIQNGATISGEATFQVTVNSANLVTQVEFYVNDDLRDKATSTPYTFTIDTLNEAEGPAKLVFKAYTSEGETGQASVNVTFNNGLDKGGPFHVQQAKDAIQNGNWQKAVTEGRIAIKVDPKLNEARLIVARAYLRMNVMDKAQKFAEDAVTADPNDLRAKDVLSIVDLSRAFATFDRSTDDRNDILKTIGDAMANAVKSRKQALDMEVDSMGAVNDKNLIPYCDAALRAGRYGLVVSTLLPAFATDNRRTDIANRLAFALIREGRYAQAFDTLETLKRYGTPDVYTQATMAVLYAEGGKPQESDDSIKDAILSDADNPIVTTAQAYIALKFVRTHLENVTTMSLNYDDLRGKDAVKAAASRNTLEQILRDLARDQGQRTEVNYYLCALNNKLENYDLGTKYFEAAVLSEPTNYDAYIEQGNKSFQISFRGKRDKDELTFLYENARTMFTAAYEARQSSAAALTGLCLVDTFEGKAEDAIKEGTAATQAEQDYAPAHIALAAAYTLGVAAYTDQAYHIRQQGNQLPTNTERQQNEMKARAAESKSGQCGRLAKAEQDTGEKLDKKIWGSQLTSPKDAWRYFNAGGRVPVLPAPASAVSSGS